MAGDYQHQPVRETVAMPINHGDPNTVTMCSHCGCYYRNGEPFDKPDKSWLRILIENWWRYGWRVEFNYGGTIPIGYGVSWQVQNRLAVTAHPIPFNVLMRLCREWFIWAVQGGWKKFGTRQDEVDAKVARILTTMSGRVLDEWSDMRDLWKIDEAELIRVLMGKPKIKSEWP